MKQTSFQIETLNHYAISLVSEYRLTSEGKAYMLYDVNMGNRILHITECEEESVSVYSFVIYDDFVLQNINIGNYISRRETIYLDINVYDVISFLRSIKELGIESRYELVAKFKFYATSCYFENKDIRIDSYAQDFINDVCDKLERKLGYGTQPGLEMLSLTFNIISSYHLQVIGNIYDDNELCKKIRWFKKTRLG